MFTQAIMLPFFLVGKHCKRWVSVPPTRYQQCAWLGATSAHTQSQAEGIMARERDPALQIPKAFPRLAKQGRDTLRQELH